METKKSILGIRFSFLTPTDQAKFEQIFSQGAAAFGGNKISGKKHYSTLCHFSPFYLPSCLDSPSCE